MERESELSSELEEALEEHKRGEKEETAVLSVSDSEVYVGDEIQIEGDGLTPNRSFDLVWNSANGRWGILEGNRVVGPQYHPRTDVITTVETNGEGQFSLSWEIPEDYGGSHELEIQTSDDREKTVAETELEIRPWFEIDRTEAPLGETFTVQGYGLGPNFLTNNYQIAWDNGMVGFITGVQNRGTATAEVRAVGPPGEHVVQVWRNYRGVPYLQNNTQSPFGPVGGDRQSTWSVTVTEPELDIDSPWIDPLLDEEPLELHYPELDENTEASIDITPSSGQPGTEAVITGENFPANETVNLVWYLHEGHRVKGIPITPEPKYDVLPTVTTDSDGEFRVEVTIPRSEGSTRPITAEVGGQSVAVTGFMMQPSIETFTPREGPVGTEIEIELSGVGWTIYENAYYFVYDNKPLGHICGTAGDDNDGIIRTKFRATGEPGTHFIDIYPSLFDMEEEELNFKLRPHLSYIDNHPVRPLPALHLPFEVTE